MSIARRQPRYESISDFNIEIVPADGHQCCRLRSGDLGKSPIFKQLFQAAARLYATLMRLPELDSNSGPGDVSSWPFTSKDNSP